MSSANAQFKTVAPRASVLIEGMRDIGYTLETALADIIDNSIAAGATESRFSQTLFLKIQKSACWTMARGCQKQN